MKTDLSDLLAQKDFEELNAAEQELVLSEISEQEYCEQRETVATAKIIMVDEAATLQAPLIAMAASSALQKKKGGVFAIFAHKVPTWAAVAACIILFTLFGYSGFFGQNVDNNKTAAIPQIDTVYVEKVITEFRDLKPVHEENRSIRLPSHSREKVVEIDTPAPLNVREKIAYSDEMLNAERINYTALLQNHSSSAGVSLQNDSISQMINRTVY